MGTNVLSNAKHFHCSCHATWLPCKTSFEEDCIKKKGFADFGMEIFYIDFLEPGNPRKAPFVLRTDDQMSVVFKSGSKLISGRVVHCARKVLLISISC